jgi:hypothetical protein
MLRRFKDQWHERRDWETPHIIELRLAKAFRGAMQELLNSQVPEKSTCENPSRTIEQALRCNSNIQVSVGTGCTMEIDMVNGNNDQTINLTLIQGQQSHSIVPGLCPGIPVILGDEWAFDPIQRRIYVDRKWQVDASILPVVLHEIGHSKQNHKDKMSLFLRIVAEVQQIANRLRIITRKDLAYLIRNPEVHYPVWYIDKKANRDVDEELDAWNFVRAQVNQICELGFSLRETLSENVLNRLINLFLSTKQTQYEIELLISGGDRSLQQSRLLFNDSEELPGEKKANGESLLSR